MSRVIIVGAGASGMMAAVAAAQQGAEVILLEKMDQPGRKLRITGKGRCNLTNTAPLKDFLSHIGPDSRFMRNSFSLLFNTQLMEFFEQRNVPLVEERGHRIFPRSGKSLDIFLALINDLEARPNVQIRKNCAVKSLTEDFHGVRLQDGSTLRADAVIIATGGLSYPTTGSTGAGYRIASELGHTIIEPVPALVPLKCAEAIPDDLVSFTLKNVQLSVYNGQWPAASGRPLFQSGIGELTFTDDGLGGPIALSASRAAARPLHTSDQPSNLTAVLDLKPGLTPEQLDRRLLSDLDQNGTRIFNDALRLWLPAELIPLALKQLHIEYYKRLNQINGDERRRLGRWLKGVPFSLTGTRDWNEAIVTQGGVALSEVNPKTMESRLVKGLYLAGELLDLDADTGGYNLQIAFSTGHAAGEAV
jgi:predicted Rossmann fold flavoprotein